MLSQYTGLPGNGNCLDQVQLFIGGDCVLHWPQVMLSSTTTLAKFLKNNDFINETNSTDTIFSVSIATFPNSMFHADAYDMQAGKY